MNQVHCMKCSKPIADADAPIGIPQKGFDLDLNAPINMEEAVLKGQFVFYHEGCYQSGGIEDAQDMNEVQR